VLERIKFRYALTKEVKILAMASLAVAMPAMCLAAAQPTQHSIRCVSKQKFPKGRAASCSATYSSISDAVNAASPGDTILVAPGVYNEMVSIPPNLTGLVLTGLNPKATIIDATGLQNGIWDQASQVEIDGFTIRNAEHEGILVQGPPANCVTQDTEFPVCTPSAPQITGVVVENNVVINNDRALQMSGGAPSCPATNNVPPAPAFEQEDCGEGIHLDGVAFSTVANNQVMNNAGGILLTDETDSNRANLVSENIVKDNVPDCGITLPSHPPNGSPTNIGAQSFGVSNDTISDNLSQGNGAAGVGAFAPTPGTASHSHLIVGNRLIKNAQPGVIFHSHAPDQKLDNTSIVSNIISGNGADPNPGQGETGPADPTGIEVYADPHASPVDGVKIFGNTIKSETNGIWVGSADWSNCADNQSAPCYVVNAHENNFAPRMVGIDNAAAIAGQTAALVQASSNYWGCPKGPGGGPSCATSSGNVIDYPFLTKPQ
jgi:parallel beta-helix repeat protein